MMGIDTHELSPSLSLQDRPSIERDWPGTQSDSMLPLPASFWGLQGSSPQTASTANTSLLPFLAKELPRATRGYVHEAVSESQGSRWLSMWGTCRAGNAARK